MSVKLNEVAVTIGRLSGPSTDLDLESDFKESEVKTIADTIAIINSCTNNKEAWYYAIDGKIIVPQL